MPVFAVLITKKMKFEIILIILTIYNCLRDSACQSNDPFPPSQQRLVTKLLTGYNSDLRPDDQISGNYIVILEQLIDINEVTQVMTSSINIYAFWNGMTKIKLCIITRLTIYVFFYFASLDSRFMWNPADYDNQERILLKASKIWL
jgi:hypothetical protein